MDLSQCTAGGASPWGARLRVGGPAGLVDRTLDPMLSLSSAGVGRTGVFITLSIVLERMRYEGVVDMFQTVKTLRTQRPAMVQTEVRGPPGRHAGTCHQHWLLPALPGTPGQGEGNALVIWPLH